MPVSSFVPQNREPSLHEGIELHMDRDIQDIIVAKALDGHDFDEIARGLSTVIRDNGSPYWNAMHVEAASEQLRRKNGERRSDVWLYWTVCPHAHLRFRLHRHDKKKRREIRYGTKMVLNDPRPKSKRGISKSSTETLRSFPRLPIWTYYRLWWPRIVGVPHTNKSFRLSRVYILTCRHAWLSGP